MTQSSLLNWAEFGDITGVSWRLSSCVPGPPPPPASCAYRIEDRRLFHEAGHISHKDLGMHRPREGRQQAVLYTSKHRYPGS